MSFLPADPDSPDLAPYRNIHGFRGVTPSAAGPCFLCEGRFLVRRALEGHAAGAVRVLSVLATEHAAGELAEFVRGDIPVHIADRKFMEELAGFAFHRGILCCVACPAPPPLSTLLAARRLVVVPHLDGVDNLGLILRSAAALGMDAVLVGKGPEVFDRRTVRVSMGAAWKLPVFCGENGDVLPLLEQWRAYETGEGTAQVAAAALVSGAVDARRWKPAARTALMLGPEGYGLDEAHLAACDTKVVIPMRAGMDSLNVAACAAILMYQMGVNEP